MRSRYEIRKASRDGNVIDDVFLPAYLYKGCIGILHHPKKIIGVDATPLLA